MLNLAKQYGYMNKNEEIVARFYTAFQQLNWQTMNNCYAEDIVFFDPAFGLLKGEEVKNMWEMLCTNAKDFSLSFSNIISLDEEYIICDWVATYTFSKTGRPVVNRIRANMRIANGLIIEHSDAFSLHKWSSQALGFSGWLLGWNRFFQRRIQNNARKNLLRFIEKKQSL